MMKERTNNFLFKYSFVPGLIAAGCFGLFYLKPLWVFYVVGSSAAAAFFLMFYFFGLFPRYMTWLSNQGTHSFNWPLVDCFIVRKLSLIEDKLKRRDDNA
jgi:hypothetical protein